jgi:cysteinyl-tRNA synthetase
LKNVVLSLEDVPGVNKKYLREFEERINDDLDMPGALAVLWGLLRDDKANGKKKTVEKMDEVFGLDLFEKAEVEIPKEVLKLTEDREEARKAKDWGKSDSLRDEIGRLGFVVKDLKEGFVLEKN